MGVGSLGNLSSAYVLIDFRVLVWFLFVHLLAYLLWFGKRGETSSILATDLWNN